MADRETVRGVLLLRRRTIDTLDRVGEWPCSCRGRQRDAVGRIAEAVSGNRSHAALVQEPSTSGLYVGPTPRPLFARSCLSFKTVARLL
jgi:hypothetical protein